MFQKKFRYMAAVLAVLMITQGRFTAFAGEIGPGYDEQNKASTDTSVTDPANAWKKVNGVYVDNNGKTIDPQYLISATSEHMRRSWGVGPVRVGAKNISVEVFNSASYASYVNDGHRQKPGRYVPILGKKLVKGWVDGLFMAERAEAKTRKAAKRIINRRIELYLKGVMK